MKDKTTRVFELIAAGLLGLYCAVMIVYAFANPVNSAVTGMKSYTFPVVIYSVMLICCLIVIVQNRIAAIRQAKEFKTLSEAEKANLSPEKQKEFRFELPDRRVLLTVAAIIVYTALWKVLGFTISTFLFIIVEAKILNKDDPLWKCAVISLGVNILIYLIFVQVFSISLPETFLGAIL